MATTQELWQQFEAIGETKVRENLAGGKYSRRKELSAREWLAHKLLLRNDLSQAESNELAKDANRAAWAAARQAQTANTMAKIAMAIGIASIVSQVIVAYLSKG